MRNWLGLVVVFAVPTAALAHKMLLSVEVAASELRIRVQYEGADHGGSGPVVKLFQLPNKELLHKKETDRTGLVVLPKPANGRYLVQAEDEFHDTEKTIEVGDETAVYEDRTGNKWVLIGVGMAVIAGLTAVGWYFTKPKPSAPTDQDRSGNAHST